MNYDLLFEKDADLIKKELQQLERELRTFNNGMDEDNSIY